MLKSRNFWLIVSIVVMSLVIAACGSAATPAPTATPAPAEEAAPAATETPEEVAEAPAEEEAATEEEATEEDCDLTGTLTFWGHANHPLDNIREAFLKEHPCVELNWEHFDDHPAKFLTAMAAGTGAPDLYWSEQSDLQRFAGQGALLETTSMIETVKDDLVPSKLAETWVESKGGYYGMPGDISASGIYYRPDVMEELGIEITDDMTYDEFMVILETIAAADKNAVLFPSGGTFVATAYWSWFDAQYGGSGPTSCDNQTATLNDEASVNAVNLIKDIYDTGSTLEADFWTPEYWNAINTDQLVLDIAPAWARGFWEENLDEEQLGKWRLAPLPRAVPDGPQSGIWGGASLVSPITTENPELVLEFMKFAYGSMEGAAAAADWGIMPPYIPYLEGPYQDERPALFGDQNSNAMLLKIASSLSTDFCRTAAYTAATGELLTPAMADMIEGDADIQETLDGLNDELTDLLPDYQ